MNESAYIRVIEILSDEPDYKKIALDLAKADPALFVKLVDGNAPTYSWFPYRVTESVLAAVRSEFRGAGKVPAIRMLREATGAGLKEAKDYVEAIC